MKRYPPNNGKAARKPCKDCVRDGVTTKRKAPHPGPRCATHHREQRSYRKSATHERHIQATFGITSQEYQEIYYFQGGRCAICRRATGARKRLSVDHDHATGIVRGLCCVPCNRNVLGHARDEIEFFERAIAYLKNPPAVSVLGERITPDMA